jgi:hypothetical protein
VSRAEAQETIQRQIRGEKASALARAVEQLEGALGALAAFEAALAAGAAPPAAAEQRQDLLEEARERLWFVVIQREAMGLRRHEVLYEVLSVPPEVRRTMGPRRRR